MVTVIATAAPSMSKHNTQVADVARNTLARSEMSVVDPTATSRRSRPAAIVDPVDMSDGRSVVSSTAMNGAPRRNVKASTGRENTTLRRRNDVVSPRNTPTTTMIQTIRAVKTHTRSE
jgi:hypothetical protein